MTGAVVNSPHRSATGLGANGIGSFGALAQVIRLHIRFYLMHGLHLDGHHLQPRTARFPTRMRIGAKLCRTSVRVASHRDTSTST